MVSPEKQKLIKLFLTGKPYVLAYNYRRRGDGYKEHKPILDELIGEGLVKQIEKTRAKIIFQYVGGTEATKQYLKAKPIGGAQKKNPSQLPETKSNIHEVRGHRVMFDFDLAELFAVETRMLKKAVRRHKERFLLDYMFELTKDECESLKLQLVASKNAGTREMPFAFTLGGVALLGSVLIREMTKNANG